jgi:hypothetical protein
LAQPVASGDGLCQVNAPASASELSAAATLANATREGLESPATDPATTAAGIGRANSTPPRRRFLQSCMTTRCGTHARRRPRRCWTPELPRPRPPRVDLDYTIDHARGGPTTDTDLSPACRHDHLLRHEGNWTITQTSPGHLT